MKKKMNRSRMNPEYSARLYRLYRYLIGMAVGILCIAIIPEMMRLRAYVVLSGSMEPEIPTGSLVFVNTEFQELSEGTVIAYQMSETVVTHRVETVLEDGYRTRGDANERADEQLVRPDQVIGPVCLKIPCLGYLVVWMQSEKGQVLVCILLITYLIYMCFYTGIKYSERKK